MAVHHARMPWQVLPYEDYSYETRCSHAFSFEKGFANILVSLLCSVDRKHPALPR